MYAAIICDSLTSYVYSYYSNKIQRVTLNRVPFLTRKNELILSLNEYDKFKA